MAIGKTTNFKKKVIKNMSKDKLIMKLFCVIKMEKFFFNIQFVSKYIVLCQNFSPFVSFSHLNSHVKTTLLV